MFMTRRFVRVTKILLAGVTIICVSWIASISEWHPRSMSPVRRSVFSTMRTIVAYSEDKQAELDRPTPVACDRLPVLPDVPKINNTWTPSAEESIWQQVEGTTVSLYSAYYDHRAPQHYIRILGIFHGRNVTSQAQMFCQIHSLSRADVEVVAAKPLEIWWHEWDNASLEVDTPLLLSCPLMEPLKDTFIVSIVTEPCDDPDNAFTIEAKHTPNTHHRSFTICVKDMNFETDISHNLLGWIEINKLLGAEIIDIYVDRVHERTEAVLMFYQSIGFVRLLKVPIKSKPERSLWQRRRDHIISYNDCLYRNIIESEYLIPLDIDEVIIPKIAYSWPKLLNRLGSQGWDAYHHSAILIRNIFFFSSMQDKSKYKYINVNRKRKKLYDKRDDVRIKNNTYSDISNVELIEDSNNISEGGDKAIELNINIEACGKEIPMPKLAHHVVRSATISPIGHYSKSFMMTKRVLTAFNHYPLANIGSVGFTAWAAPLNEVQLNHYKESCNTTLVSECGRYMKRARIDDSALRLKRRLTRALTDALCSQNINSLLYSRLLLSLTLF